MSWTELLWLGSQCMHPITQRFNRAVPFTSNLLLAVLSIAGKADGGIGPALFTSIGQGKDNRLQLVHCQCCGLCTAITQLQCWSDHQSARYRSDWTSLRQHAGNSLLIRAFTVDGITKG